MKTFAREQVSSYAQMERSFLTNRIDPKRIFMSKLSNLNLLSKNFTSTELGTILSTHLSFSTAYVHHSKPFTLFYLRLISLLKIGALIKMFWLKFVPESLLIKHL